jgi:hypothetical protein
MKYFLLIIFILSSCAQSVVIGSPHLKDNDLAIIHKIWEKKDPSEIALRFPEATSIAEKNDYYVVGIKKKNSLPSLRFVIDKKSKKIESISYWLKDNVNNADYIESSLPTDDWKRIPKENKVKDLVENRMAQFSFKLGVSFIYDEFDKKRKVWMVYWGTDPEVINW